MLHQSCGDRGGRVRAKHVRAEGDRLASRGDQVVEFHVGEIAFGTDPDVNLIDWACGV